ncbi:MAG TPA: helix-turn-helix domain-containing protein [Jiangellaceae bacterium]|nr:helix-turn-helix domain-containing protein [Jiangellaceae bacterium]
MNTHASRIIDRVAAHYGITRDELLSRDRHKSIAEARQVAMWLCRELLGMSYPELGRAFGNRDHTTCIAGVRRIARAKGTTLVSRTELRAECALLRRALPEIDLGFAAAE